MSLTDIAIRRAKTRDKPYKLYDELGLFLDISPSGWKLWRMKFRNGGSEKKLSFGAYPQVSLRDARDLLADSKRESTYDHWQRLCLVQRPAHVQEQAHAALVLLDNPDMTGGTLFCDVDYTFR